MELEWEWLKSMRARNLAAAAPLSIEAAASGKAAAIASFHFSSGKSIFADNTPSKATLRLLAFSSLVASTASGMPLGLGGEKIAILPAAYEDDELRRTLEEFDTVILMKVSRVFDRVYALLKELGREKQGVFVRRVGSPEEEVHFDLEALVGQKLDYLSMLIVKKGGV